MRVDIAALVDPELLDLLACFPEEPLTAETLSRRRALPPVLMGAAARDLAVRVSTKTVDGSARGTSVVLRLYEPARSACPMGCIFHMHGGGYVLGSAVALEPLHRDLCSKLNCVLVSVEYRLAPETRFPGNIEDCYCGLQWVFGAAVELNIDVRRIGVMGESSGGGLAASLALLARDRGECQLAFQHLIYPMLDDRTCIAQEPHPFAGRMVWTLEENVFGWSALLGHPPGSPDVSAYAAPARAEDLKGLPPTFMATGALDLFLEENIEYARRLTRAGVPVEMHVYPRAFHGFDRHPSAKVAAAARQDSLAALSRFVGQ